MPGSTCGNGGNPRFDGVSSKKLKALQAEYPSPYHRIGGIPRRLYEAIDNIFNGLPLLQTAWQIASSSIVNEKNGEERFWIYEDVGIIFNDSVATENQSYKNAPAIVTRVGLLATFVAILVALLDVQLASNRIQGLDLLIHGLSGRFLSSVVAISCAAALVFVERGLFHPVNTGVASLCLTLRRLLPRLTSAQILLNLREDIAKGAQILKNLESGFVVKLNESLTETAEPAIERMASRFNESLTGATQSQLGQIS